MKNLVILFSLLLSILSSSNLKACHGMALVNYSFNVGATGITVNGSSDPSTCGCGPYWMQVEIACSQNGITGNPPQNMVNALANWNGPGVTYNQHPWYNSLLNIPNYTSAGGWFDNCVLEPYNPVFIPFSALCAGQTYYFRAREWLSGNSVTPGGPWTAMNTFTVPGAPALSISLSANTTTICPPGCATLTANVNGGCITNTNTITWSNGLGTGPGPINVCPSVTTTYTVTATPSCGPPITNTITINVSNTVNPGIASLTPNSICSPTPITLSLAGATGSIQWQSAPSNTGPWTNIPGATSSTFVTAPVSSNTCFQAIVTGCNSVTSNIVCVTTQPLPPLTVNTTNLTCFGINNGTATASSGFTTYTWSNNPLITTNTINNLPAGTYTVTGSIGNGCNVSNQFTITEPPQLLVDTIYGTNLSCNNSNNGTATVVGTGGVSPYQYNWLPSGSGSNLNNLPAGTYTVNITDANNCVTTGTINITQPNPLSVQIIPTQDTICFAGSTFINTIINGGTNPYTYTWSGTGNGSQFTFTPNTPGFNTLNLSITDINGCQANTSSTIYMSGPINVSANVSGPACSGNFVTLTANAIGGNNNQYSYTWIPGNINGNIVNVNPTINTTYSVIASDGCSPNDTTTVNVIINPQPTAQIELDTNAGCEPLTVLLNSNLSNSVWSINNNIISNTQNNTYTFTTPGTYTVNLLVTANGGCQDTTNAIIYVYPNPIANFNVTSSTPLNIFDPSINITNNSSNAYLNFWQFGDGNTSNTSNPYHTYQDTGTYIIDLLVTSQYGCKDSTKQIIHVDDVATFYIPNAISLSSAYGNNLFFPKGTGYNKYDMYIFNRWGELIYETHDSGKWDGKYHDVYVQEDTYVYKIIIHKYKGFKKEYHGHVNVIK